jgi:hypothetical protein
MDINMHIKGCLLLISKDIFFHSRYSRVYPAISFISSNSFIDIQPFIHLYPAIYRIISLCILTFILLDIRSGSRLIWLVVTCCLIRPSFECQATVFLFPRPQMRRPPAPVVGGASSGPVAAATPAPVVAGAAAGYRRRRRRRLEWGEGTRNKVGGRG